MSESALKRITLALVALVLLYGILKVTEGARRSGGGGEGAALESLLEGVTPEAVRAVSFVRLDDTIRLEPSPEGWRVNGYAADQAMVDRFWEEIGDASVGALVARNPANHERVGVTEGTAAVLTLERNDGETATLLIGNPGPSWTDVHARLQGEDEVYLIRGNLRSAATRTLTQWRDKHIAALDTASVALLRVETDGVGASLAREGEGWLVDGEPAEASRVRSILSELARLDATDFAPDTLRLPPANRELVAMGAPGDTLLHLRLAPGEAANWWLQRGQGGTIYQMTSWRVGRLAPAVDSLRATGEAEGG